MYTNDNNIDIYNMVSATTYGFNQSHVYTTIIFEYYSTRILLYYIGK